MRIILAHGPSYSSAWAKELEMAPLASTSPWVDANDPFQFANGCHAEQGQSILAHRPIMALASRTEIGNQHPPMSMQAETK